MKIPEALCLMVVMLNIDSINAQSQQYNLSDFENQLNVCLLCLYFMYFLLFHYKKIIIFLKGYVFTCVKFNTLGFKT